MFPSRRTKPGGLATGGGDVFRDEYSLAFDGTDDYVDCGSQSDLDVGTSEFTVSAWVKFDDLTTAQNTIVAKGVGLTGIAGDGWWLGIYNGNQQLYFDMYTATDARNNVLASGALSTGIWYHIVATKETSGSDIVGSIYINGKLKASSTFSGLASTPITDDGENFKIGAYSKDDNATTGYYLSGNISEVVQYDTGLTASQVKTLYNGREPYNYKEGIVTANLKGWWRMGDGDNDSFSNTTDTTADTTGLIQDMATPITKTELVTGWTNGTFSTPPTISGLDITDCISDGSGNDNLYSNAIDMTAGDILEVFFTISGDTIPSSANELIFKLSEHNHLGSTQFDSSITGAGDYHFFATFTATDSSSYVGFRASSTAVDFDVRNFSCKKVAGGSNGIILNVGNNFEGDTP